MNKLHLIWIIPLGLILLSLIFLPFVDITLVNTDLAITSVSTLPPPASVHHEDFWEAVFTMDLTYAGEDRPPGGERDRFAQALSDFLAQDYEAAAAVASDLATSAGEEYLRLRARDLLLHTCIAQNRWDDFLAIGPDSAAMAAGDTSQVASPTGRSLATGFNRSPPETWMWPIEPVELAMETNIAGHALIAVTINGARKQFIIDTGADMSVITSDLALEIGLEVPQRNLPQIGTSTTNRVSAAPIALPELRIGDLVLDNHRAYCVASETLEFKVLYMTIISIDGIIGWNAIRHMCLELDYERSLVRISRPGAPLPQRERSLRWAGDSQPLVRGLADGGQELWFFLDTGANMTSLHEDILNKVQLDVSEPGQVYTLGAGGAEMLVAGRAPDVALHLGNYRYIFPSLGVHPGDGRNRNAEGRLEWFSSDGVLGIDVAAGGLMLIDATAGRFEVRPLLGSE
ncbi:MAG: hypothetical protein GY835_07385 [bacterium]|nr:hypothetical protein [bacterium]